MVLETQELSLGTADTDGVSTEVKNSSPQGKALRHGSEPGRPKWEGCIAEVKG